MGAKVSTVGGAEVGVEMDVEVRRERAASDIGPGAAGIMSDERSADAKPNVPLEGV